MHETFRAFDKLEAFGVAFLRVEAEEEEFF